MPSSDNTPGPDAWTILRQHAAGAVALIALPAILMLVVFASKYEGLRDPVALDHAQLARHIAEGDGLVTTYIRPLSVAFKADISPHPDLYNAPLHPLILAGVFRVLEATERVAVGMSAWLWLMSVWVTFLLGFHWFGWRAGLFASVLYGCNVAAISAAMGAMPHPLFSIISVIVLWLALPKIGQQIERVGGPGKRPGTGEQSTVDAGEDSETAAVLVPAALPWRIAACGLACALATLAHFPLGIMAVVIGWSVVSTSPHRGRALGLFLGGFFAGLSPWIIRSALITGSPFFNLYSYEALGGTGQFPGDTVWRFATPPDHPALFLFHHPVQAVIKLITGLNMFRRQLIDVMDPLVVVPFFAAALDRSFASRWRWPIRIGISGVVLTAIVGSILKPDTGLLLVWVPLYCVIAAGWFTEWLPVYAKRIGFLAGWRARPAERGYTGVWAEWWIRAGANIVVCALLLIPLMNYIMVERPAGDIGLGDQIEMLKRRTLDGAVVLTDQPAQVAWNTSRRAIWLPQREQDLVTLENTFGQVDATFVTRGAAQLPASQRGDWWYWVTVPTGVYRGLSVVEPASPNAIVRVRTKAASK